MDEMRQLVRILVKLLPDSLQHLAVADEGAPFIFARLLLRFFQHPVIIA